MYVHAKVAIVDDCWLTLGSANLNAHSFYNDSGVVVQWRRRLLDIRIELSFPEQHVFLCVHARRPPTCEH